jgi:hypothetical protein
MELKVKHTVSAKSLNISRLNLSMNTAYDIDSNCEIKKTKIDDGFALTISFPTKEGLDLFMKRIESARVKINFVKENINRKSPAN